MKPQPRPAHSPQLYTSILSPHTRSPLAFLIENVSHAHKTRFTYNLLNARISFVTGPLFPLILSKLYLGFHLVYLTHSVSL